METSITGKQFPPSKANYVKKFARLSWQEMVLAFVTGSIYGLVQLTGTRSYPNSRGQSIVSM